MRGRANATPTSESAIALSTVTYRRAPGAFLRRTPDSLVILAADSAIPVRISGSAVDVWEMLAEPRRARDLLAAVAERVGAPAGAVAGDLEAALDVLTEAGAVVVTP